MLNTTPKVLTHMFFNKTTSYLVRGNFSNLVLKALLEIIVSSLLKVAKGSVGSLASFLDQNVKIFVTLREYLVPL